MPSNRYYLLSFLPAVEAWEMLPSLEAQARRLVASGKLRIHTDTARNFVRFDTVDIDATFTLRELTDPQLRQRTRAELARHVPGALGEDGVDQLLDRLTGELKRTGSIAPDKEMKVARVMVQSAHPAVVELMLSRGTEILVSYAHNVADLMPVHRWEEWGTASGLQATEARALLVYVSCGGDPFFEGEQKTYTTDGFPALARMVVIAGQETGHFSDLIHGRDGSIHGRYSMDNSSAATRPGPEVQQGRRADMQHLAALDRDIRRRGLARLRHAERAVKFYRKQRRFIVWTLCQLWRGVMLMAFVMDVNRAPGLNRNGYIQLRTYPRLPFGEAVEAWLDDMAFNLAPDADVYRRADPLEEEAIACIEALARVPQQVNKWGHKMTRWAWPMLYRFYYGTVIPGSQVALIGPVNKDNIDIIQKLTISIRRLKRKRPGYWPDPADPV